MTKKRKTIYLSVLGAGMCVVAYDLLSGDDGPAKAKASSVVEHSGGGAVENSEPKEGLATLTIQPFPRDIQGLGLSEIGRDIFAPSEEVIRKLLDPPAEVDGGEESGEAANAPPVPFHERHRLSAIMRLQGSRSAIVDGVILRDGQQFADCTVIEIAERNIRFDCPGAVEELWLDSPLLDEQRVK